MRDKDTVLLESAYTCVQKKCRCSICGKVFEDEIFEESASNSCNGYIIFHGSNYVCIATNVYQESKNPKTGNMVQVYIISSEMAPSEAIKQGRDSVVCFDCKHRGTRDPQTGKMSGRTCYVNPMNLNQVYKTYKKGNYPIIIKDKNLLKQLKGNDGDVGMYLKNGNWDVFSDKYVRFGAYGEPVKIPFPILEKMAQSCQGFTSYTHQWSKGVFQGYKEYCMASVDTAEEYEKAKSLGWRTFRVSPSWYNKAANEEACQFSVDGTQCVNCLKCSGKTSNDKDIYVAVHGSGNKVDNFIESFGTENDFSEPLTQEDLQKIKQIEKLESEEVKGEKKNKVSDLEIFNKARQDNKNLS